MANWNVTDLNEKYLSETSIEDKCLLFSSSHLLLQNRETHIHDENIILFSTSIILRCLMQSGLTAWNRVSYD
jgi:hypothetical protein